MLAQLLFVCFRRPHPLNEDVLAFDVAERAESVAQAIFYLWVCEGKDTKARHVCLTLCSGREQRSRKYDYPRKSTPYPG